MDQGVRLTVADMPNATDFQLHIFAALAQEERRLISERTRNALAEAKRRGVVLGKNGHVLAEQNRSRAKEDANRLRPIMLPLVRAGESYSAIARHLNKMGVHTSRGRRFYPQSVRNVASRIAIGDAQ
jgi:DNA invertase Pin-like site-specific DNA recombinase